MATFWKREDLTVRTVATLIGCQVDSGLVNRFNEIEEAGGFAHCATIGDFFRAVALNILADAIKAGLPTEEERAA